MVTLDDKRDELLVFASTLLNEWGESGKGLRSKELKNFTSGDHNNIGLEGITSLILDKAIDLYGLADRVEVNQTYIEDSVGIYDRQRMDQHIWIDGKLAIIEEDRAFIDKPFYTMKRGVVKCFMELPHTKKVMADEPIFIFLSLGRILSDLSRHTADAVFGYGDTIREANLSGWGGRGTKGNYFDLDLNEEEVLKYISALCEGLEKYV